MENSQKKYVPVVLVFSAFFTIVLTSIFYFHFFSPTHVEASATDNLSGYAWSENIGWISFNCTDTGTCATSPYGVTVSATGALSGYAWSENIGWVSFNAGDVSGCPSGTCAPSFDKISGNVTGWAKALSAGGGWDGFISLSGINYGVSVSGCAWGGWAWGSDVVGWVSFGGANGGTVTGTGNACKGNPPTLTFGANPTSVYAGATSTLTWTVTGTADSCWASGAWTGWKAFSPGAHTEVVTVGSSTATYSIECWNSGASSGIQNAVVTVTAAPAPGLTLSAGPTTINLGGTSTLSWVVSGSADSCIATGAWSGNKSPTAGSYQLNVSPIINSIYNLECWYKGSSSGIKTATVNIAASCPAGVSKSWTVGSDTCTGTTPLTNGGGNGTIIDNTSPPTSPAMGSATYSCSDGTWAGSPNAGATCSSKPNLSSDMTPVVNGTLKKGDIVTFSGRVRNTGSLSINSSFTDNFTYCWGVGCTPSLGIGSDISKTVPFAPNATQNDTSIGFTLSNSGTLRVQHCIDTTSPHIDEGDESTADNCKIATLTVVPPPTGTITAIPAGPYDSGGSSKITWSANDATSCEVQVAGVSKWTGITHTTSGGEPTGPLYVPTRYDLMCKNALFTSFVLVGTANVTVTYIPELTATRKLVNDGGTTTLMWDTNNGNEASCTLNNGTGDLITANVGDFSTGSVVVTINGRTTYKLTCPIPPSGSESDSVTIEVVPKGYET